MIELALRQLAGACSEPALPGQHAVPHDPERARTILTDLSASLSARNTASTSAQ